MKSQIWIGDEPIPEKVEPIQTRDIPFDKPQGGFWTSSENADGESQWIKWCRREDWWNCSERNVWRLTPREDIRILHVDKIDDLSPWFREDWTPKYPDWEQVFQCYEGVHLTEEGVDNTRHTEPGKCDLYSWDTESTLWDGWYFEKGEKIGEV